MIILSNFGAICGLRLDYFANSAPLQYSYRRAFRKWPGMTLHGDGWTPGPATKKLARWLDANLKVAQLQLGEEINTRSTKTGRGKEYSWCLNHLLHISLNRTLCIEFSDVSE